MIEKDLFDTLKNDATVAGLVGTRIYPLHMPQGVPMPAVVYQRISTTPINSLDGDTGVDAVRMQVSCWAATYLASRALSDAVRAAVTGNMPAVTEMDMTDRDDELQYFRTIMDFRIWDK